VLFLTILINLTFVLFSLSNNFIHNDTINNKYDCNVKLSVFRKKIKKNTIEKNYCVASFISKHEILTSAKCFANTEQKQSNNNDNLIYIENIENSNGKIIHLEYNNQPYISYNYDNDIDITYLYFDKEYNICNNYFNLTNSTLNKNNILKMCNYKNTF
jgi:secreted trypsin-like serine protease